jgi:hypothetical protein
MPAPILDGAELLDERIYGKAKVLVYMISS